MTESGYYWEQISMWEGAPKDCIQVFKRSECGEHIFHFYLRERYDRTVTPTDYGDAVGYKTRTVTGIEGVPDCVLEQHGSDISFRINYKTTKICPVGTHNIERWAPTTFRPGTAVNPHLNISSQKEDLS